VQKRPGCESKPPTKSLDQRKPNAKDYSALQSVEPVNLGHRSPKGLQIKRHQLLNELQLIQEPFFER